jgi:hypothetical protein
MTRTIKFLAIALGLGAFGTAHAFTVAPLSKAQQKVARADIKAQLPAGSKVRSVKFGFGPTPVGFIGSGFEHATVRVKENGKMKTVTFTVSPGLNGGVNVFNLK